MLNDAQLHNSAMLSMMLAYVPVIELLGCKPCF